MRDVGLVNILCDNELIIAQVVNKDQDLYRSLNVTMGPVNVFDVIEAKKNEEGILEYIAVVEEGVPHKELFFFKDQESWTAICVKAADHKDLCVVQGLAMPKGPQPGVVAIAYETDFSPIESFGDLIQQMPEE
jgi:hypothetical protein